MALIKDLIKRTLHKTGYRLSKADNFDCFPPLLCHLIKQTEDFSFVQVGANDGRMMDPIYDFVMTYPNKIRGVALEPVKPYFEALKNTYRRFPNITPLNLAIHNSAKEMELWRINPEYSHLYGKQVQGIASFDPTHHRKTNIPDAHMLCDVVACTTLSALLKERSIERIDLLQIDTEGYDAEILKELDFHHTKPGLIRFEHGLRDGIMPEETFTKLAHRLHEHGYEIAMADYDATAYQRTLFF